MKKGRKSCRLIKTDKKVSGNGDFSVISQLCMDNN